MENSIKEGQRRLEEKRRVLSLQTPQKPTGLADHLSIPAVQTEEPTPCPECGHDMVIPQHTFGLSSIKPYCRECDAKREAEEQQALIQSQNSEAQQKQKLRLIERYTTDSCIGKRFLGKTFSDYKPVSNQAAEVLCICKNFADTFQPESGRNLILTGATGPGKNMLSAIIGQTVIQGGNSFLHTTAMKVVRRFKDSWKQPEVTEAEVLRYFVTPDLLAIDEIGVQFGTDTEQLYLTEVINDRYEAKKPTILISNLTMQQIEDVMGLRSIERFHEDGSRVLVFSWTSYRRQQSSAQLRVAK